MVQYMLYNYLHGGEPAASAEDGASDSFGLSYNPV